jgi:hypothetical protein
MRFVAPTHNLRGRADSIEGKFSVLQSLEN